MLAKEKLDGVSLCTLPSTHRDIAIDLLSGGVHVLCEKPLAVSEEEAGQMARKALEQKRLLVPAFKLRFYDEVREAKRLIEQGGLGRILTFRLMFADDDPARGSWASIARLSGGGVIMDNGPHAVDLIHYLLGEISSVAAQVHPSGEGEVEDTATLTCGLANGIVGSIDLSWRVGTPSEVYLEIYGEDGTARLDLKGVSYKFKSWPDWRRVPNASGPQEGFGRQINHFVDAIASGGPVLFGAAEGVRSQEVIEAAYRSLVERTSVRVSHA